MPKKSKIKKSRLNKKQKGGGIDLNRKNDTNYDNWIQYLSIALLVVALILGISVFMQHNRPKIKEVFRCKTLERVEKIIKSRYWFFK